MPRHAVAMAMPHRSLATSSAACGETSGDAAEPPPLATVRPTRAAQPAHRTLTHHRTATARGAM